MTAPPLTTARTAGLAAAGLALIAVCYGLARFAYGLFVPSFRAAFDLDAATAGTIAGGSYVAYGVGVLLATALTPRVGARIVAIAAGVLATAGTALIAAAPDAGILALGVLIAGSSTGVASPPLAHAVARRVAEPRRDRLQTIVNAGTGLGVLVSGPVALIAADQWRLAWAAFAVIAAVVTVWAAFAVPSARDGAPTSRTSLGELLLPTGAVRLYVAAAVMGVGTAAMWTFAQDLLIAVGGQPRPLATLAWIVLGACGLIGAAAGDLARQIGLSASWIALMLALALSTTVVAWLPGSAVVAVVASGVFGAVYIALTGILLIWSTRVHHAQPSRGVGLVFLALALGQALGAPLLGLVADAAGLIPAFLAAAALSAAGAVLRPRADPARP